MAFDFATRPDAAGFIRPKIKISLPVGRGIGAEREEATRPVREKKRANLQTTGRSGPVTVYRAEKQPSTHLTWRRRVIFERCDKVVVGDFYTRVFTCIREARWLSLLKAPVLLQDQQ